MEGKPPGTWQQYYCAAKSVENGGDPAQLTAPGLRGNYGSVIPSLNKIADPQSPPFDVSIPDIYRYQMWKQDFEKNGPASFNMVWLSSDHGGPNDSEAGMADNDLATGDIVDTISHSPHWEDSAIFVLEDDSQDGADHVDGHRAPVQVISPWAQHGKVINTYYSQISAVRMMEQILGAHGPEQGGGPEDRGARERAGHRRCLADLARQPAHQRQRCVPRLRQPGADEPAHVVPGPRVEGALPG